MRYILESIGITIVFMVCTILFAVLLVNWLNDGTVTNTVYFCSDGKGIIFTHEEQKFGMYGDYFSFMTHEEFKQYCGDEKQ